MVKPVTLPPGWARLSTKPLPTGSLAVANYDRNGFGGFQDCCGFYRRAGQDHIRLERQQFLNRGLQSIRRAEGRTELKAEIDAFDPASLPQAHDEATQAGGRAVDHAPSGQFVVERQCRQRSHDPYAIRCCAERQPPRGGRAGKANEPAAIDRESGRPFGHDILCMVASPRRMLSANGRHPQLTKKCVCDCSFAAFGSPIPYSYVGSRSQHRRWISGVA
ncbi:hypothetical protein ACVWZK_006875 [Bradyrhizobium sp. GM0.4]